MYEKYFSAVAILNEYQEAVENQDNFFQHSLPMVECTLQPREELLSDEQVPGMQCNPHSCIASPVVPNLKIRWSGESLKLRQYVHHSKVHGSLFCKVRTSPRWHTGLWTFKIMGHGSFG
jgi:hypothetical protein